MNEEFFEIYDETGNSCGLAKRSDCHGNPKLIHRTVHVMVFHPDGRILLQQRCHDKDIQPGKWDTAVGGHVMPGEIWQQAARRELKEELGIEARQPLEHSIDMKIRNQIESEDVRVFKLTHPGPFTWQESEIITVRFWTIQELNDSVNHSNFTPNLICELKQAAIINQ